MTLVLKSGMSHVSFFLYRKPSQSVEAILCLSVPNPNESYTCSCKFLIGLTVEIMDLLYECFEVVDCLKLIHSIKYSQFQTVVNAVP